MSKLVLEVPTELNAILKRHREVPWARVAEEALWEYARKTRLADRLASRSRLSVPAAGSVGHDVKKSLGRRYRKLTAR